MTFKKYIKYYKKVALSDYENERLGRAKDILGRKFWLTKLVLFIYNNNDDGSLL